VLVTDGLKWKVGAVKVTTVIEHHDELAEFFPSATKEDLAAHGEWLTPWALSEDGQLRFVIQAICLDVDGQKIVVDTCIGARPLPEAYTAVVDDGTFIHALAEAGFGRDEVDLVICAHLHFDHVGRNTMMEEGAAGCPLFGEPGT
jgi:glyoxylase-like metal-dependent hydrolase (beta-lactamase superfamily II)